MTRLNHHLDLKNIVQVISPWLAFSSVIHSPTTDKEYDTLVKFLDQALDLPPC